MMIILLQTNEPKVGHIVHTTVEAEMIIMPKTHASDFTTVPVEDVVCC